MSKFWSPPHSSSGSSTSQRGSFQDPGGQCQDATSPCSPRQLKSYKAFGKIRKASLSGAVAMVQNRLKLGKNARNDKDQKNRDSRRSGSRTSSYSPSEDEHMNQKIGPQLGKGAPKREAKTQDPLQRFIKNTSNVKDKVNEEVYHMSDSSEEILPYLRVSTDCVMDSFDTSLNLVEQLMRESKDSEILMLIRLANDSYTRSMELYNHKLELAYEKNKQLKDEACSLREKLSASREAKLKHQISRIELLRKLSSLRYLLELMSNLN